MKIRHKEVEGIGSTSNPPKRDKGSNYENKMWS